MPLQYPLAPNARAALDSEICARTVAEARELASGPVELVSDFLRPGPADRERVQARAEACISRGFVQLYEDAKGNPVIAVSYWKPVTGVRAKPKMPAPEKPATKAEDHTDDLYFNKPGARDAASAAARRRRRIPDPNQMDLFGPDQQEAPVSHDHDVVIVSDGSAPASSGGAKEKR
ncbi:MAG: hypothetical protein Q8R82_04950 [Hyphomonadaceae bacterium]|nr:hypothetical protein [Hyphomonadaceae bacterium]